MQRPNLLVKSILLTLVAVLVTQPILVAAQPQPQLPSNPIEALTASGDVYLTHVAQGAKLSIDLTTAVESLNTTLLAQRTEASVAQARARALQLAEHSASALGAVRGLAEGIEQISSTSPEALDVAAQAQAGLPDQFRQDLIHQAGLSLNQVDALQSRFQDFVASRLAIATSGLPATATSDLQAAGFSQSEIDQLTLALAARGLADTSLTTRLAQLRASRDELVTARSVALVISLQLLSQQIAVRQTSGLAARAVTEAELESLVNDELRLLIHVAHLKAEGAGDPTVEAGEGDWWFIERYATRAAERLDGLILESQNRALVVDLFIIETIRLLALSARSGDPLYALTETSALADLLAIRLGDPTFVARQQKQVRGLARVLARLAVSPQLHERVEWPVDSQVRETAVGSAQAELLATGVVDLTLTGALEESNEENNLGTLLFAVGLPYYTQLAVDILQGALDILAQLTPRNLATWLRAILTGDTEDPALMVASMLFSLIPVLGVIPDIYSLVMDPSIFVKALSLVGIVGSIGDLIALIPGAQAAGGAAFLGDAASAVIKNLFKHADEAFRLVLDALKLTDAFEVVIDLIKVVIRAVGEVISHLGNSLDEVFQTLTNFLTGGLKLWDDFVAFVRRVGPINLLRMGFDEGSAFVGRILRRVGSLTDEAIGAVDNFADEAIEAGFKVSELSDEATEGLGKLAQNFDSGRFGRFSGNLSKKPEIFESVLKTINTWDEDTLLRLKTLSENLVMNESRLGDWLAKYANQPEQMQILVRALGDPNPAMVQRVTDLISRYGDEMTDLVARHGVAGREALAKMGTNYGDELIKMGKDPLIERGPFGEFVEQMGRAESAPGIPQLPLPLINPNQAYEMSQISKGLTGLPPLDIGIAGRWADTPEDVLIRVAAAQEAAELQARYLIKLPDNLPPTVLEFANAAPENRKAVAAFLAKTEVAPKHDILWSQVKISTTKPEVDAFIPLTQWKSLSRPEQTKAMQAMADLFDLPYNTAATGDALFEELSEFVDMYQAIENSDWMVDIARLKGITLHNPATTFPNGSVRFMSSGEILHPPITGPQP